MTYQGHRIYIYMWGLLTLCTYTTTHGILHGVYLPNWLRGSCGFCDIPWGCSALTRNTSCISHTPQLHLGISTRLTTGQLWFLRYPVGLLGFNSQHLVYITYTTASLWSAYLTHCTVSHLTWLRYRSFPASLARGYRGLLWPALGSQAPCRSYVIRWIWSRYLERQEICSVLMHSFVEH